MVNPYNVGTNGVVCWNNAEGGTDGAGTAGTVAASQTGSGNAWTSVTITAGALTYSATSPIHDNLSYLIAPSAAACTLTWNSSVVGAITGDAFGVLYLSFAALPGAEAIVANIQTGAQVACAKIYVTTSGQPKLLNSAGTALGTMTATMSTNTVYRLEWKLNHTTGAWQMWLYAGDSLTEIETISGTGASIGSETGRLILGRSQSPDWTFRLDTIAIATQKLGPRAGVLYPAPVTYGRHVIIG